MKTTVKVLSAVALIFAIAACSKNIETLEVQENNQPETTGGKVTESLIAKTENDADTKMAVDGLTSGSNYSWSVDTDKIAAFVTSDEGANYTKVESGAYNGSSFSLTYDEGYKRGGFAVYPYEFAKSYSKAGGLVVTYPNSYDISAYITNDYLSEKVYDVHSVYFPMPMIATSTSGNSNLEFYSIGAMVRVKVSNIPAGTKVLYITFNQKVTGDFTIALPNPGTSVVSATSGTTTVAYRIAAEESEGLTEKQAENAIVLYIPVPVATDLSIASTTTTKTTVRNGGKSFAVDAITCTGDGSFATTIGTFFVAPGNLLAHNDGGVIKYSFLSGIDQLKHTMGSLENDPHVLGSSISSLASLPEDDYKDMFTWEEVSSIFADGYVPGSDPASYVPTVDYLQENGEGTYKGYHFPQNHLRDPEISGHKWIVPRDEIMLALTETTDSWYVGTYKRNGDKATVGGQTGVFSAKVIVNLKETSYAAYATYGEGDEKLLPGLLLFPDGYVDQTNAITFVNNTSHGKNWNTSVENKTILTISYNAFAKMVENGAMFLPCVGVVGASGFTGITTVTANWPWCYLLNDMAYLSGGTTVKHTGENISATGLANGGRTMNMLCSVRLVREVLTSGASAGAETRDSWDTTE